MRLEVSDVPPVFAQGPRPAGKSGLAEGVAHGLAAAAVARVVDLRLGDCADIGPAAEELAEVAFLVAPRCDVDGAVDLRIRIDDAGGFERIDDAQRTIEPARKVLALEMRSRQQFRTGFFAGAEDVADAVDLGCEACVRKPLRQPLQPANMRLREGRLVNAGLVGADGTECVQIGKDSGTVRA